MVTAGPELGTFATKLAAAIARRHALDDIAGAGEAVPPGLMLIVEAEIRAAEAALKQGARHGQ